MAKDRDDYLLVWDAIFSAITTVLSFTIVAAYIVLYMKFMNLIKTSNGFLDFMKTQTHSFFLFVFAILTVKIVTSILFPIQFDYIIT